MSAVNIPHIVAFLCQGFYAWRIYRFGGWIAMPIIIIVVRICVASSPLCEIFSPNSAIPRAICSWLLNGYTVAVVTISVSGMIYFPSTDRLRRPSAQMVFLSCTHRAYMRASLLVISTAIFTCANKSGRCGSGVVPWPMRCAPSLFYSVRLTRS
jgi:hypothetical protein